MCASTSRWKMKTYRGISQAPPEATAGGLYYSWLAHGKRLARVGCSWDTSRRLGGAGHRRYAVRGAISDRKACPPCRLGPHWSIAHTLVGLFELLKLYGGGYGISQKFHKPLATGGVAVTGQLDRLPIGGRRQALIAKHVFRVVAQPHSRSTLFGAFTDVDAAVDTCGV
jgi:hypothetical protein